MGKTTLNISENILDNSSSSNNDEFSTHTHSLEEALNHIPYGKFHILLTIISGFTIMGMAIENINISFVIPYMKCDLEMTAGEQGFLSSVSFLGIVVSSHFWGFLADTWGRRKVIRLALFGGFTFAFISAFATTITMLICFRFIVGLCFAGVQAATYSHVTEFHSQKTRHMAVSFVAMFMPAVLIFLPILAWLIIPMNWSVMIFNLKFSPWRLYLICSSAVNVMNFIAVSYLPESPKFVLSMEKKDETMKILQQVYTFNCKNSNELYPIKRLESEPTGRSISNVKDIRAMFKLVWNQTWPLFVKPHAGPTLKLCYLMFVLFSIGNGTLMWFPDFLSQMQLQMDSQFTLCEIITLPKLIEQNSTEVASVSLLPSTCVADSSNSLAFQILFGLGVIFTFISAIISFFIDKIGPKCLINIWIPLSAIACLNILWLTNFYAVVFVYMIFLSCGTCAAILSAISVDLFPSNIRAMATCAILMFGRLGSVYGSNLVGIFLDTNCDLLYYINFVKLLSCLVVFYFLVRENPSTKT